MSFQRRPPTTTPISQLSCIKGAKRRLSGDIRSGISEKYLAAIICNARDRAGKERNMNKVILMGRLTRDPEVRYSAGDNSKAIARYTLAVDRRTQGDGQNADFIGCVAFGRSAEFAEKYLRQGTKIVVTGRIQTGSYTNRDGKKVYTTDVVVEDQEFAESKSSQERSSQRKDSGGTSAGDGFMNIPDGIDEEIPFA